jgi:hypothetical protein
VLWLEEVQCPLVVALSTRDGVVGVPAVRAYLDHHKQKEPGADIRVVVWEDFLHGQVRGFLKRGRGRGDGIVKSTLVSSYVGLWIGVMGPGLIRSVWRVRADVDWWYKLRCRAWLVCGVLWRGRCWWTVGRRRSWWR